MRLFIVIEETAFYHPHFLSKFLRLCRDQVVGVALVTRVPDKHNIEKYMMRHWYYLKFGELCRLGWQKYYYRLMDLCPDNVRPGGFTRSDRCSRHLISIILLYRIILTGLNIWLPSTRHKRM